MHRYLLFPVLCALSLLRCGVAPLAGGSTDTELGSVVTGMVHDDGGRPSLHTQVHLIPQQYNPVTGAPLPGNFTDTTDSAGGYAFDRVPAGGYSVFAENRASNTKMLITGIAVDSGVTSVVSADSVRPTGDLAIEFPDQIDNPDAYVYIPGTFFHARVKNRVVINGIPPGRIPALLFADRVDTAQKHTVAAGVNVVSGTTVNIIDGHSWNHSMQLYLNTSPSGADVAGDVTGFPVLVRLTGNNFSFGEAQARGGDVRFTKFDGTLLPCEIERWDTVSALAEVWVRVDTVHGNDSTQSITMHWDNAFSSVSSNGASVFDTANGFTGVWHLGESSGVAGDATVNRFDGSRAGNQTRVAGAIGYGQYLDGDSDYFEMGNAGNPDTCGFTVSAWVKPSTDNDYRAILSKSYGDGPSSTYGWLVELGDDGALAVFAATDNGSWGDKRTYVAGSNVFISDTVAWHYVTAVFDRSGNAGCHVYIDGVDVPPFRGGGDIAGLGSIVNSAPLRIGADANGGCPWKGAIDECSIALTARSPDWVKLCYMNQKKIDKLVVIRNNK